MNMLIVDDDEGDRLNLHRECKRAGLNYQIFDAESVEQAFQVLREHNIHCVLMDYALPGNNGLDGIRKIHQQHPYLPIIMLTCYGDESLAVDALKSGAVDYFAKDKLAEVSWQELVNDAIGKTDQKRKLDEKIDYLSHFASMLTHDLKAPIGHILGFIDLARQFMQEGNMEGLKECYIQVEKSSHNLANMIEAIAVFAHIEKEVEMAPVALTDAVDNALDMLGDQLNSERVSVDVGPLPEVIGNIDLLTQAFLNLIGNSIKFNHAPQPRIHIYAREMEREHIITLTDNGVGIPESAIKEIFKPFARGHDRNQFAGTGLGLSIVQKIIHLHDGSIEAGNLEQGGAAFTIRLPAVSTTLQ